MADQLANINALLKPVFGVLKYLIPEEVELLNYTTKKLDKNWNLKGSYFEEPVNLTRSKGILANTSNILPESGQQGYANRRVTAKTVYTKNKFDRRMIERTKDAPSVAAFGNIMKEEFRGVARDAANRLDIMMYGDGTGIVATVRGNQIAGQTVIELNPYLGGATTQTFGDSHATRYLEVGDQVAFLNSAAPATVRCIKTITAVDYSADTITVAALGAPEALTDGDFVVFGQTTVNEYNMQIEGLESCFATADAVATYQNISSATYRRWRAKVMDNGAVLRPLTFNLINRALNWPVNHANAVGKDLVIFAHNSLYEKYVDLCDGDIRYVSMDLVLKRGAKQILYVHGDKQVPFVFGRNTPYHTLYVLDTESWEWDVLTDWHPVKLQGGELIYAGDNKDEYFAYSAIDANLSCFAPNRNVKVEDIIVAPEAIQI